MSNNTGQGKWEEGMRLQAENGLSDKQVAKRLGYATDAAWRSAKSYYKKRAELLKARSQPQQDAPGQVPDFIQDATQRRAVQAQQMEDKINKATETVKQDGFIKATRALAEHAKNLAPATSFGPEGQAPKPITLTATTTVKIDGAVARYQLTDEDLRIQMRNDDSRRNYTQVPRDLVQALILELTELSRIYGLEGSA